MRWWTRFYSTVFWLSKSEKGFGIQQSHQTVQTRSPDWQQAGNICSDKSDWPTSTWQTDGELPHQSPWTCFCPPYSKRFLLALCHKRMREINPEDSGETFHLSRQVTSKPSIVPLSPAGENRRRAHLGRDLSTARDACDGARAAVVKLIQRLCSDCVSPPSCTSGPFKRSLCIVPVALDECRQPPPTPPHPIPPPNPPHPLNALALWLLRWVEDV